VRLIAALAAMPAAIELLLVNLFPGVAATDLTATISALLVALMPFRPAIFGPVSAGGPPVLVFALMFHSELPTVIERIMA
jgi:hypothetical protein